MNDKTRETLEKQLQLLSERLERVETDSELKTIVYAICSIAHLLDGSDVIKLGQ